MEFENGLAPVKIDNKWGFIDKMGHEIISPKFNDAMMFENGLAPVKTDDKRGFIDKTGREIISPKFNDAKMFENGLAPVKTDNKWGFIDKTGREIIAPQYNEVVISIDPVTYKTGYNCQLNPDTLIIDGIEGLIPKSDYVSLLEAGLTKIQFDRGQSIIYNINHEITTTKYDQIEWFEGKTYKVKRDGKWGLIDETGREFVTFQYDEIENFKDGFAAVKKDNKWGLIDRTGHEVIAPQYDISVNEIFGWIRKNGKYGYIDTTTREIIPCFLDNYHLTAEHAYLLYCSDKKGLLFTDEKTYIPPEYDEIAHPRDEWVMVMKNNRWGWVDHRGNVKIPCRYDAATPFNGEGWATVFQFGMQFRINKKGEMIWRKGR